MSKLPLELRIPAKHEYSRLSLIEEEKDGLTTMHSLIYLDSVISDHWDSDENRSPIISSGFDLVKQSAGGLTFIEWFIHLGKFDDLLNF